MSKNLRVTELSRGFIETTFADAATTGPDIRAAILKRKKEPAIPPTAIARAITFAIEQPGDVEIGSMVVRPTAQH